MEKKTKGFCKRLLRNKEYVRPYKATHCKKIDG